MKKLIAAAVAAASLFTATVAWAGRQDFRIHNETGQAIINLYVSPSSETNWGPDILGVEILAAGEDGTITFDRDEEACLWDVKVNYQDGSVGDWRQINLCETTDITLGGE